MKTFISMRFWSFGTASVGLCDAVNKDFIRMTGKVFATSFNLP